MRILHITPAFHPARYHGGQIVYELCNALACQGADLQILTTDTNESSKRMGFDQFPTLTDAGYPVYYCRRRFAVSVAPRMLWPMVRLIHWANLIHLTEVYSFPTIPSLLICSLLEKPVVWSPHGALQRWRGSRRVVLKGLWEWICRIVAPQRLVLHVTSEEEAKESIKRFPGARIALIPLGVPLPDRLTHMENNGTFRILYLGRINPIKGIENLLAACKFLKSQMPWVLTIAGPDDLNYARIIKAKIENLNLSNHVNMVGEVVAETKERVFENADILVMPSYKESFGRAIGEALAHGVPVIASKETPWRRIEDIGCGLWVNNDPKSLAKAIEQMSQMPLPEMGQRGRAWMQTEFSWCARAKEMVDLYRHLIKDDL